jgi:hypothetical protein
MTAADAKLRRATALLTNALRGGAVHGNDLQRRVHDALRLVVEAAVREAKGLGDPPAPPRAAPVEDPDDADGEADGPNGDDDADEEE